MPLGNLLERIRSWLGPDSAAQGLAPAMPEEGCALDQSESCRLFYAGFIAPDGSAIRAPGLGDVMPMSMQAINLIKEGPDFLDQIRGLRVDYSKSFMFNGEFDVHPLIMNWFPEEDGTVLVQFCSFSTTPSGMPMQSAPCTMWLTNNLALPPIGVSNVFEGFWDIKCFPDIVNRYSKRPLALIATAKDPGDPLSAAALTFAGAHFLLGLTRRFPGLQEGGHA